MTETNTTIEQNSTGQLVTSWKPDIAVRAAAQMIYGTDREGDKKLWEYETLTYIPVFAQDENRVYVANKYNSVDVLDKRTGEKFTQKDLGVETINQLLQDKGVLFVASRDDVAAYRIDGFQRQWEKRFPVFEVAKAESDLIVSLDDYKGLLALDSSSGETKWHSPEGVRHVTADNSGVYGNRFGFIKKVDKEGKKVWESTAAEAPVGIMRASNGKLYVGTIRGGFSALDAQTGNVVWKTKELRTFPWQMEETDKGLEITVTWPDYVSHESRVIRLNPETGKYL